MGKNRRFGVGLGRATSGDTESEIDISLIYQGEGIQFFS
jgi:hypothetical protein